MKNRAKLIASVAALVILDLAAFYLSMFLAVFTRADVLSYFFRPISHFIFSFPYFASIWWIPVIFISVTAIERLYVVRFPFWEESKRIIKTTTLTLLFVFFMVSVRNILGDISRLTFFFLWLYLSILMPIFRYWGKRLLYFTGIWKENTLVLGSGDSAVNTVKGLTNEKQLGYRIIGFLDDNIKKHHTSIEINKVTYQVHGKISQFTRFVKMLDISTVIIAIPGISKEELTALTGNVQKYIKTVMVVPDLAGIAQLNTELHYLFMQKTFLLKINNNLKSTFNRMVKMIFDGILSILLLPFLLIFIAIFALMIKLDSRGPVFIIQERLGKNDIIFKCIKFRTMYLDPDRILEKYLSKNPEAKREWKLYRKLKNYDPRVTGFGKFLRSTSLDELPQIFNILKGDMSLVGPRPYLPAEKNEIKDFMDIILLTRPGMTGLWQVSGRNDLFFEERIKLDTWYVQNWSLWLDMMILLKTFNVVFKKKGAY
jgi:Undecaprenyl-phosphate galactose phosphotransferase WbaP